MELLPHFDQTKLPAVLSLCRSCALAKKNYRQTGYCLPCWRARGARERSPRSRTQRAMLIRLEVITEEQTVTFTASDEQAVMMEWPG